MPADEEETPPAEAPAPPVEEPAPAPVTPRRVTDAQALERALEEGVSVLCRLMPDDSWRNARVTGVNDNQSINLTVTGTPPIDLTGIFEEGSEGEGAACWRRKE